MKFQFTGNLSAAEWFLAESAILSKITSIKLKLVVSNMFKHLLEGDDTADKVRNLLENSGFSLEEVKSILACLDYIIANSVKYAVGDQNLLKDLISLGLPKENCESIVKVYKESGPKLAEKQKKKILKIGQLENMEYNVGQILASKMLKNTSSFDTKFTELSLKVKPHQKATESEEVRFTVSKNKAMDLINELKKAQEIMENLKINNE